MLLYSLPKSLQDHLTSRLSKEGHFVLGMAHSITTAGFRTDGIWLITRKPLAVSTAVIIKTHASRHLKKKPRILTTGYALIVGHFLLSVCKGLIATIYCASRSINLMSYNNGAYTGLCFHLFWFYINWFYQWQLKVAFGIYIGTLKSGLLLGKINMTSY